MVRLAFLLCFPIAFSQPARKPDTNFFPGNKTPFALPSTGKGHAPDLTIPATKHPTVPPDVPTSGFEQGRIARQSQSNENRLDKVEEKIGKLDSTVDWVKGVWAAVNVAVTLILAAFITLGTLAFKHLGKHIAYELVERHKELVKSGLPAKPAAESDSMRE